MPIALDPVLALLCNDRPDAKAAAGRYGALHGVGEVGINLSAQRIQHARAERPKKRSSLRGVEVAVRQERSPVPNHELAGLLCDRHVANDLCDAPFNRRVRRNCCYGRGDQKDYETAFRHSFSRLCVEGLAKVEVDMTSAE
jgi:hypothetical protein